MKRIQNQAAGMLKKRPRRNHITPVLKDLRWLRINERIEFQILILTHKSFYEAGPIYFSELIKKNNSSTLPLKLDEPMIIVYHLFPLLEKCVLIVILNDHLVKLHFFLWNRYQ